MRTISVGSFCLSSCSQLSPYYPSFFGSLSLSGEPGHCPEHPWASPAVPCPSSSLLHFPTSLKTKLSHGPASEPLCAHSRCIHIPAASTLLHPTQAGTLEGKEESGHHPDDGGQCGKRAGPPSPTWQPLVNRNRAWWSWLLPEAHTRLSVIKAISHLRTGELQAGAAAAGNAWGLVLGGRVGTSGQKLEGAEDQRLPSVWPGRKGVQGSEELLSAIGGARGFFHKQRFSFLFSMGTESLRLVKHPHRCHLSPAGSFASPPLQKHTLAELGVRGLQGARLSLQLCWEHPRETALLLREEGSVVQDSSCN